MFITQFILVVFQLFFIFFILRVRLSIKSFLFWFVVFVLIFRKNELGVVPWEIFNFFCTIILLLSKEINVKKLVIPKFASLMQTNRLL
jgi:hypothetical protein